jgi:hypothetical protein
MEAWRIFFESVPRDALRASLTVIFHASIGAYRKDGQD